MVFSSIKEICDEFGLDSALDIPDIIKKLTAIQVSIHPDKNSSSTTDEASKEKNARIDEAKSYLRHLASAEQISNSTVMIPATFINDITDMIGALREITEIQAELPSVITEKKCEDTAESIFIKIRKAFLPQKITLSSIIAVLVFIFSFPKVLAEHPIFEGYFRFSDGGIDIDAFAVFTAVWFFVLCICVFFLVFTFLKQRKIENVIDALKSGKMQYEIYQKFKKHVMEDPQLCMEPFHQDNLEKFILETICPEKGKPEFSRGLYSWKKSREKYSTEIIPVISELIIQRALEKKVVKESEKASWYDGYIFL